MVPLKPPTEESTMGRAIVLNTSQFFILASKTWSENVTRHKDSRFLYLLLFQYILHVTLVEHMGGVPRTPMYNRNM
jgi:hypothetical protein